MPDLPGPDADPGTWKVLDRLLDDALDLPAEDRGRWLDELPAEYEPLKPRLRSLLSHARRDDALVETLPKLAAGAPSDQALASERLEPGYRLGPYEIVEHIGSGGMGDVYLAHDARLARDVAVKVMHGPMSTEEALARFRREARAIAALSHPNVLAIYDVGDARGSPYLVTELLEGETLRARSSRAPLPVAQALQLAVQIAHGLAAAHARGIVHRDLKPENLFLLADGRIKILDFGIARPAPGPEEGDAALTSPGQVVGTVGYVAPEVAAGRPATAAADLFALGAILFELLTGRRAFDGDGRLAVLRAVAEHEPPPPSSLRPEVPHWVDRIVARCLAKDVAHRFQAASDLAFALSTPVEGGRQAPGRPPRLAWRIGVAAAIAAGVVAVVAGLVPLRHAPRGNPPRSVQLTFSGRDSAPAISRDGRFLAFASDRQGRQRIWLQQLDVGREVALTDGPDHAPRFSPDGNQILFTRTGGGRTSLHRVGLLGGELHKVVDDASEGDWSPDGRQVVFVRWRVDGPQARPSLVIAGVDGSSERELARLDNRVQVRPRWSPDGRTIAVTGLVHQPGAPQTVLLIPVDGSPPVALPTPSRVGLVSAVAWDGPDALLYSQAASVSGNSAGSAARVVRQTVGDGVATTLLWSSESSLVLDRWAGRGIVYDASPSRQILREVTPDGAERFVPNGTATDRQPIYSPDGERILFSSNRGPNLDIWSYDRRSGETRRLTDHPADDWDPALTPDGRSLLWSSSRSGNFEVWMADADGAHPRQVTRDGVDAENPTATRDGQWIVYSSGAPGRVGIWKVRPDGTDATLLVRDVVLPEVSPDGTRVLFQTNRSPGLAVVGVALVADGRILPFEIRIAVNKPPPPILGRARWMPDGRAIAFVGQDEQGATGVFVQPFVPGEDTTARRVALAGFHPDRLTESFGVAPSGKGLVLAEWEKRSTVMATSGLPR